MTHEQALQLKQSVGNSITLQEMDFEIMITPLSKSDLNSYMCDYRVYKFDDKSCLRYSSDGQFAVYGLWTDGVDVIHKHITEANKNDL